MRGRAGALKPTSGTAVRQVDALPSTARNGVRITFINHVDGGSGISAMNAALFESVAGSHQELCSPGNASWLNGRPSRNLFDLHSLPPTRRARKRWAS